MQGQTQPANTIHGLYTLKSFLEEFTKDRFKT